MGNMAKAKFPGKPSKTSQITRLRVSSKWDNSTSDPSRIVARETAFGLQLFNDNFPGDDEDEGDFVGFQKIGDTFELCFQQRKQNTFTNLPSLGTGDLPRDSESVSCRETVKNPVNEISGDGHTCERRKIRDSYSYSLFNGERGSENCLARKL